MKTTTRNGIRRPAAAIVAVTLAVGLGVAPGRAAAQSLTTEAMLDTLQHTAFNYFWLESNLANGLIRDRSTTGSPCSIASLGFGLSAICIGIDRGWVSREDGRARIQLALETLWNGPQSAAASGTIGYKGLYYHFLDMFTARRTWDCELSTIDSALLFAGVIDAKQYFDGAAAEDVAVRALCDSIYYRADWMFMRTGSNGLRMGWKPGTQFNGFGTWVGYNEAMILYILALGSPTHPIEPATWITWTGGYQWGVQYGYEYVRFPPLFGHQYSHCWIDYRNIWDSYMQSKGITYFENSRRATLAQQAYCAANPGGHVGYSSSIWGLTASDDPFGYSAHGAPPPQNDNGTITPTAAISSVVFTPAQSIEFMHAMWDNYRTQMWSPYGFKDAMNLNLNWFASDVIGIDQGPIIVMIENYRTGAVWERFMANADVQRGLQRAGFVAAPATDAGESAGDAVAALVAPANPVRSAIAISFRLPRSGRATIELFDAAGRRVRRLFDGQRSAGTHAVPFDPAGIPSGVYFYRLNFETEQRVERCVVLQ